MPSLFLIASATNLNRMVFGIALRPLFGEPLLRTRNVVIHMRKCTVADRGLAGRQFDQRIARIDGRDLRVRPAGGRVEIGGVLHVRDNDLELIGRRERVFAVVQIELQGVAQGGGGAWVGVPLGAAITGISIAANLSCTPSAFGVAR